MYRKFYVSLAVAAVVAPIAATASAAVVQKRSAAAIPTTAPAAEQPKPMTREQFLSNLQARFNAVDTNHNGVLEESEIAAAQQKELQQLQAAEQQRLEQEFQRLDTNHDGQLSKAEFLAAAPPVRARETATQLIAGLDSNKDGKVSLQEYEARPLETFSKLDANHDGTVTTQEIQAARSAEAPRKR